MKRIVLGLLLGAFAMGAGANEMATKSFKDLDKNADGKLSSNEVGSVKDLTKDFRNADTNGDGYLSEVEYNAWTAQHATPASKQPTTKTP